MFEGNGDSVNYQISKNVTESIAKNTDVDPQYIHVIFNYVNNNDWAISREIIMNKNLGLHYI